MNIMSSTEKGGLARNMTAVGTMGEMGQLFTVYEKNWNCKDCGQENYSSRYIYVYDSLLLLILYSNDKNKY